MNPPGAREPGETGRRKSLGRAGESIARQHLESIGFRILETNFRRRNGEIDIIAFGNRTLVFCEVKTRIGGCGNPGEDAILGYGERQRNRMISISEIYAAENIDKLPVEFDTRYDLIIIGMGGDGRLEIAEHIADAFRPY